MVQDELTASIKRRNYNSPVVIRTARSMPAVLDMLCHKGSILLPFKKFINRKAESDDLDKESTPETGDRSKVLMRLKYGLEKELGRREQGPIGVQGYVYDLRCAYLTAKKWHSAAHELK